MPQTACFQEAHMLHSPSRIISISYCILICQRHLCLKPSNSLTRQRSNVACCVLAAGVKPLYATL